MTKWQEAHPGYQREWYQSHRKEHNARSKQWYAEHKEQVTAYQKKWRAEHPEKIATWNKKFRDPNYQKQWQESHPEEVRAYLKKYASTHPEKIREKHARRHARKMNSQVSPVNYKSILLRDGYICHICKETVDPADVHFDHVIPLARGGAHLSENIKVSHSACNLKKNSRLMSEL